MTNGVGDMNARVERLEQDTADGLPADEIRHAVDQVVASAAFSRAPRMCALLLFLVDEKLNGRASGLTEYAIGMAVFRRDAAVYETLLDPVVRVQIGRLRSRLADYYAAPDAAAAASVQITIPAGGYIPALKRSVANAPRLPGRRLELAPLRNLTLDRCGSTFACGVDEELGSRMFGTFPHLIQLRDKPLSDLAGDQVDGRAQLRLEGSIRVERDHVRASMRLVDTHAGHTAWASQFDCSGELGMALQEQLALTICEQLQRHFATATARSAR